MTFRFLDFRSGPSGGGHTVGRLADGVLPRRLHLEGTLYEVDQTFRIQREPCIVPPEIPTPPGGGGIVIGAGGDLVFVHPAGAELGPSGASAVPTLEELGITAPDGAVVSYDAVTGELTVTGEGDLLVEGTAIDLPGLTSVTIETPGSITLSGTLTLPPDVALRLEAGGFIAVEGEIVAPGGVVVNPPEVLPIFCTGLRPIFGGPNERPVGVFSLVASAARQIGIAVQRGRGPDLLPGLRRWIEVAILGSDALDIRDVDESSLRLGPGEAEPTSGRGRPATRRGYANRDRHLDLLARFDVRDAGIACGDDELCLVAETTDGEVLEGCDAIRTLPQGPDARARPSHAAAPHDGATSTPDSRRSTSRPHELQGP